MSTPRAFASVQIPSILRKVSYKSDVIESFLNFLYEGYIVISYIARHKVISLARFAHQYQIQDLLDSCISNLRYLLEYETIIEIYQFAKSINSQELQGSCIEFTIHNSMPELNVDFALIQNFDQMRLLYQTAKELKLQNLINSIEIEMNIRQWVYLFNFDSFKEKRFQ
jgi:hypothetical protein